MSARLNHQNKPYSRIAQFFHVSFTMLETHMKTGLHAATPQNKSMPQCDKESGWISSAGGMNENGVEFLSNDVFIGAQSNT
jgi:hypothetical protein